MTDSAPTLVLGELRNSSTHTFAGGAAGAVQAALQVGVQPALLQCVLALLLLPRPGANGSCAARAVSSLEELVMSQRQVAAAALARPFRPPLLVHWGGL